MATGEETRIAGTKCNDTCIGREEGKSKEEPKKWKTNIACNLRPIYTVSFTVVATWSSKVCIIV